MFAGFLSFILKLPQLLWYLCTDIDAVAYCKEIAEKPFICPNCGKEFHVKWNRLWFTGGTLGFSNKVQLKCPHCKVTDACRWTGMDRMGDFE